MAFKRVWAWATIAVTFGVVAVSAALGSRVVAAEAATGNGCLPGGGCVQVINEPPAQPLIQADITGLTRVFFDWQLELTGPPISRMTLRTHLDPGLRVETGSVYVDDLPAVPATTTFTGRDVVVDLSAELGHPVPQVVKVDFAAVVSPHVTANLSSSVDVSIDDPGHRGPVVVTSAVVHQKALLPDLALSGTPARLVVSAGRSQTLGFTVANRTPGTDALVDKLIVRVPPGVDVLAVHSSGQYGSRGCTRAGTNTWQCSLPHPGGLDTASVAVRADPTRAPGTGQIVLTVLPDGGFDDSNLANNTATVVLQIVAPSAGPTATPTVSTAGSPAPSTGPQLAATGPRAAALPVVAIGILAVVFGTLLVAGGRRSRDLRRGGRAGPA